MIPLLSRSVRKFRGGCEKLGKTSGEEANRRQCFIPTQMSPLPHKVRHSFYRPSPLCVSCEKANDSAGTYDD
jgi:hypothetical protein